jgi:hypothetical protein
MAELSGNVFKYIRPWRYTRLGGRTENVAVCPTCRNVVAPIRVRRTRTGTHGEQFYAHEHQLVFLVLEQSNSGNRHHYILGEADEELKRILDIAGEQWSFYGADEIDVAKYVKALLRKQQN